MRWGSGWGGNSSFYTGAPPHRAVGWRGPPPTGFQVEPKMPLKGTNVTKRRWALRMPAELKQCPTQHKGPCSHGSSGRPSIQPGTATGGQE